MHSFFYIHISTWIKDTTNKAASVFSGSFSRHANTWFVVMSFLRVKVHTHCAQGGFVAVFSAEINPRYFLNHNERITPNMKNVYMLVFYMDSRSFQNFHIAASRRAIILYIVYSSTYPVAKHFYSKTIGSSGSRYVYVIG